ncbi:class I SAM-dependent methyltransferase [Rubrivirga litoralis]|uniref:Class I SAM-dependent methyltransferase n=1 Tax=Rubrivirga litoralis TaxID=3075598 RepID=A0ABU3BTX2_9BACT|nr:class I SAM-dependent methyltransferase [Rubrivirga sp. F394]MDT0632743.1 class I SAM-dependent methyltransferase [Rubrivirga sp. F394]
MSLIPLPGRVLVLLAAALAVPGCLAQSPAAPPAEGARLVEPAAPRAAARAFSQDEAVVYEAGPRSADGTGRYYLGREIARVMSHRGAAWLERPDREREERPALLVQALGLAPDDVVADLGAGTGYFTFRLAPLVPEGRVYAVDIQPEMLRIVEARAGEDGVGNVAPVLGTETSPGLRPRSTDLTLVVDAYHEFSDPREMLAGIFEATRPGGRLVLVEYRAEDPDVPIKPLHKMTEAQARREVEAAGFRFVENRDVLPQQHILVFERPAE